MKKLSFLAAIPLAAPCFGQLRIVNYNTLDGPTPGTHDNASNMQVIMAAIGTQSINGIAKRPDLLILQEQTNASPAALAGILNALFPGASYQSAIPAGQPSSSDPHFIDRQAFIWDSTTLSMIGSGTSIATGELRPVIRGQFRPAGYTSAAASFYAYGAHLMASDPAARANQAAAMRANSNSLGAVHAVYAGDFNLDSNQEQTWQNLVTGAGEGLAVDPLNPTNLAQTWHNSSAFAGIHTQSTRVGQTPDDDGGATGGMDDRFDVQISTQEMQDGEGLSYLANTYRAFGQDGQHFNAAINASPTIPLGSTVANALWDASDHLPVVVDYQLPAKVAARYTAPARVLVNGAAVGMNVRMTNPAVPNSDEVEYTLTGSGAAGGSFSNTIQAQGAFRDHILSLDSSTVGTRHAVISVDTTSQGAENLAGTRSFDYDVVDHAQPSFSPTSISISGNANFRVWGLGETIPDTSFTIYNVPVDPGQPQLTAGFTIQTVSQQGVDSDVLFTTLQSGGNVPGGSSITGIARFTAGTIGLYQSVAFLTIRDEDIPGVRNSQIISVVFQGRIALPGDATLNNSVDIGDFALLGSNFNSSGRQWEEGDFTHDGTVNISDFSILAANFNRTAVGLPRAAAVPEPGGAVIAVGLVAMARIRKGRR